MTSGRPSLRVVASGMCCALGYHGDAVSCALRAGMDHFQESQFVTGGGERVRVARLPEEDLWGAERLAQWARLAVQDCLAGMREFGSEEVPLLLLTLEAERPHGLEHEQFDTALAAQEAIGLHFHDESRIVAAGRAGFGQALLQAAAIISAGMAERVLLVGVDSLLNAATINHYLSDERLLTEDVSDGFLPGEGAAALLLEASNTATSGLHIAGVGRGEEPGRPDGSVPSLSTGLSDAIRGAFKQAGIDANALDFRLSDQNGEAFFAKDAANALTRSSVPGGTAPMTLTTADCTGEIGAATGPLMTALMHRAMPRDDGPGRCGLIHLANDHGERAAIVLRLTS